MVVWRLPLIKEPIISNHSNSAGAGSASDLRAHALGPQLAITLHIEKVLEQRQIDPDNFTFAVVSDVHIWERSTEWTDEVFRGLLQRCTDAEAAFIFVAGDLGTQQTEAPRDGVVTGLADVVTETIASVPDCPPVFFGIGNHELDDAGKNYWLDAIYPGVIDDLEGSGNDRFIYFSFNVGGCHFVSLDSHGTVPGAELMRIKTGNSHFARLPDEQLTWLESDLETHRDELTFVFMHEPCDQVEHHRPWHMLQTRGRLVGALQRFPKVRWLFQGHTHHYSLIDGYGLNICHIDFQSGYLMRVREGTAALHDLNDELTKPTFLDLAAHQQSRWLSRAGRCVFQVAPAGPEVELSLFAETQMMREDGSVVSPDGNSMLRVETTVAGAEDEEPDRVGYLAMDFILEIKPGTTFSYNIYVDSESAHDHVALSPLINTRDERPYALLRDQNGVLVDTEPERLLEREYHLMARSNGNFSAPTLEGRAMGRWYERICDLSHLAGGWIVGVVASATLPPESESAGGHVKFYLSSVEISWPES